MATYSTKCKNSATGEHNWRLKKTQATKTQVIKTYQCDFCDQTEVIASEK